MMPFVASALALRNLKCNVFGIVCLEEEAIDADHDHEKSTDQLSGSAGENAIKTV